MKTKLIAGDFPPDARLLDGGENLFLRYTDPKATFFSFSSRKAICITRLAKTAEQITQENRNNVLARLGLGVAGGALLGPIGAVAGLLGAGNRTEICFACELQDGRKLVGVCGIRAWQHLRGAIMGRAGLGIDRPHEIDPAA